MLFSDLHLIFKDHGEGESATSNTDMLIFPSWCLKTAHPLQAQAAQACRSPWLTLKCIYSISFLQEYKWYCQIKWEFKWQTFWKQQSRKWNLFFLIETLCSPSETESLLFFLPLHFPLVGRSQEMIMLSSTYSSTHQSIFMKDVFWTQCRTWMMTEMNTVPDLK